MHQEERGAQADNSQEAWGIISIERWDIIEENDDHLDDDNTETAMILPGKYSQLTEVDEEEEKYDVRQNLKTFKEDENDDQWDFRIFWIS